MDHHTVTDIYSDMRHFACVICSLEKDYIAGLCPLRGYSCALVVNTLRGRPRKGIYAGISEYPAHEPPNSQTKSAACCRPRHRDSPKYFLGLGYQFPKGFICQGFARNHIPRTFAFVCINIVGKEIVPVCPCFQDRCNTVPAGLR